jgi:hypothetical protein
LLAILSLIIIDITTGYVPYVEDSNYVNQPSYRYVIDKGNNDNINKNNSFGFRKFFLFFYCETREEESFLLLYRYIELKLLLNYAGIKIRFMLEGLNI